VPGQTLVGAVRGVDGGAEEARVVTTASQPCAWKGRIGEGLGPVQLKSHRRVFAVEGRSEGLDCVGGADRRNVVQVSKDGDAGMRLGGCTQGPVVAECEEGRAERIALLHSPLAQELCCPSVSHAYQQCARPPVAEACPGEERRGDAHHLPEHRVAVDAVVSVGGIDLGKHRASGARSTCEAGEVHGGFRPCTLTR